MTYDHITEKKEKAPFYGVFDIVINVAIEATVILRKNSVLTVMLRDALRSCLKNTFL